MNKPSKLILILATAYYIQLNILSYLYLFRTSKLLVCGGWVVKNFTDNKAISAPSWGFAGWLGLSLAIMLNPSNQLSWNLIWASQNTKCSTKLIFTTPWSTQCGFMTCGVLSMVVFECQLESFWIKHVLMTGVRESLHWSLWKFHWWLITILWAYV